MAPLLGSGKILVQIQVSGLASFFTGTLDIKSQTPYNTRANKTKQCL